MKTSSFTRQKQIIFIIFSGFILMLTMSNIVNGYTVGEELALAYGRQKLTTHGISESAIKESDTNMAGLYTICANYEDTRTTQRYLADNLGEEYYHPLHISRKDNTACFVVIKNESSLQDLDNLEFIRSHTRTPPQLKIHDSALSLIFVAKHDLSSSSLNQNQYLKVFQRRNGSTILSRTKLVITFGVGAIGKHRVMKDQEITIHDIKRKLLRRSPTQDLSTFIEHSAHHIGDNHESLSQWKNAIRDLNEAANTADAPSENSLCPDNLLDLELMTPSQLVLGNLNNYIQSTPASMRQSCVMSMMSHFLSSYSGTVADLRLRFPKFPNNHVNKGVVQTKVYSENYPYHTAGLDGTGQIIGVGDTGVDELSCFFRNSDNSKVARSPIYSPTFNLAKRKIIQYINYADGKDLEGGHGTHVSGTIAGNSAGFSTPGIKYGGHASGAKIAFFDMEDSTAPQNGFQIPSPMADYVFQPAYDAGARIHSNSWGSPMNAMDDDDLTVDSFQYSHSDFLAIFAAGNDGSEGFYSIGSPGVTKNSLTVGASRSESSTEISKVAYFSSLGPTFDERIKPEVVGPGYYTTSAYASPSATSCYIVDMAGTSMATPLVAGMAAQLRQYFQTFNPSVITTGCSAFSGSGSLTAATCDNLSNPRGSTIKAMLIHSGEPMAQYDNQGESTTQSTVTLMGTPDMYQGFGRVALPNILPYPGIETVLSLHVVETTIEPYQEIVHTVAVADTSRPFKTTIVWMDPDNTVMTHKMLLNDLNLRVITPSGEVLYGNNVAGDEVNNVEQVSILTPSLGTYTVTIISAYLVTADQDFSLIVTGGGLSFTSHQTSAPNIIEDNPKNCSESERLVVLTALDHGGNGWGTGNSYEIRDTSDNSLILSDTLSSASNQQFRKTVPVCLPYGKTYSISLITDGAKSGEMGIEVSPCNVYLSKYLKSTTFSITSSTSLYCGDCESNFQLEMTLAGSFYGVPYGWTQQSHYSLWHSASSTTYAGTLLTGMYGTRFYCLPSGTWYLEFSDVPNNDDGFFDDNYLASYYGVEEYQMIVSNGVTESTMNPGQRITLTVTGTSASMSRTNAGPTRSPTRLPTFAPTFKPSGKPTLKPTTAPTRQPTFKPSVAPSALPTLVPTPAPSISAAPTREPTTAPTRVPSVSPTFKPSIDPTLKPTTAPSSSPTSLPTRVPSVLPTFKPSTDPTLKPTTSPTREPTFAPTQVPSVFPTFAPSHNVSDPSFLPSPSPTLPPTTPPTDATSDPSAVPSLFPSITPTPFPSITPTPLPSQSPIHSTISPTFLPSSNPTFSPSFDSTFIPTISPTIGPIASPSIDPSSSPSLSPTLFATHTICFPGDRDYCTNQGVCDVMGAGCSCDDSEHFWPSEKCSTWHYGPELSENHCCFPNEIDYYCSWLGSCDSSGRVCICHDSDHRLPSERCFIYHDTIPILPPPTEPFNLSTCPPLIDPLTDPNTNLSQDSSSSQSYPHAWPYWTAAILFLIVLIATLIYFLFSKQSKFVNPNTPATAAAPPPASASASLTPVGIHIELSQQERGYNSIPPSAPPQESNDSNLDKN